MSLFRKFKDILFLMSCMRRRQPIEPTAEIENELSIDCVSLHHVSEHPLAHNPQGGWGETHTARGGTLNPGTYIGYIYIRFV